jgi:predicted DNA-binding transcriptional regulator AlpA
MREGNRLSERSTALIAVVKTNHAAKARDLAHPALPADDSALTTREAAKIARLSERTLEGLRKRGGGPAYVRLRPKAIRYLRSDLLAWMQSCRRLSTSDRDGTASEAR